MGEAERGGERERDTHTHTVRNQGGEGESDVDRMCERQEEGGKEGEGVRVREKTVSFPADAYLVSSSSIAAALLYSRVY